VPDDPVTRHKPKFFAKEPYMSGIIVAHSDIERSAGLKSVNTGGHPVLRPGNIPLALDDIFVFIVLITDIERGVGEYKIDKRFLNGPKKLDTISANDFISEFLHLEIIQKIMGIARGK